MGRTKEIEEKIEKQIVYDYTILKKSNVKLQKKYNLSQYMINKVLDKYLIKKRNYIEAKQVARKYPCDDNFFKKQNEDMAYILGLIASDGSISKKENLIAIQLQHEDVEILNKISEITKNTRPLESYIRKETGHEIDSFRVWSAEWKKDLSHYGIIPQKTFTLQPPEFLDPDYRIDYIRGYFDGDGSIYKVKQQNRIFFEITGASKVMIDWIANELANHYHILLNKPLKETLSNGTIIYKIKIGSKQELLKLYNLLYNNKNLYIKRKYIKFQTLLNIPRDSSSLNEE